MVKWKLITAGLLVLSIILCMMTIYTQREYYFMQMMYTRVEAENIVLKKDYEKLYDAYYSYDKKILKSLEANEHVFWARDSSAYVVKNENEFLFSFYKKPKMEHEMNLWISTEIAIKGLSFQTIYENFGRVDTLKPHQFILVSYVPMPYEFFIATSEKNKNDVLLPKEGEKISWISMVDSDR